MPSPSRASRGRQQGAALLVLMLVVIVAASTMLMSRLNEHAQTYARNTDTQIALDQAKRALLNYAMNYPDLRSDSEKGPGFLPCPFVDDDGAGDIGNPESNCSVGAGTTIGRLPYRILGLDDPRDSSGERLWYALSDNFKNVQTGNPVINSDTRGQLSVDGTTDIVAVVIAPGMPVTGQTGRTEDGTAAGFATLASYLEGTNATGGAINFATTDVSEFNDQIVAITRAELMDVVEKRVASEVRGILAAYRANPNHGNGRYPWLTPFTDPRSSFNPLRGTHTGSANASSLTDSSRDFYEWRVQAGDVVRNVTDGSVATVTTTPSSSTNTLSLTWAQIGTDNDFDAGDEYVVNVSTLGGRLKSTATAGSSGTTLADSNRDFVKLGVTPGDVVDKFNGTNRSSGVVLTVASHQITVSALAGAATNSFASGDVYLIRSNYGQVTTASATSLIDTNKNFITAGIAAGDLVVNVTDGSLARVASVTNATTLAMDAIHLGIEDDFDVNDYYYIPRLNTNMAAREGLLSIHERGKHFPTAFDLDWSLLEANGIQITPSTGTQAGYVTWVKSDIGASASTYSVDADEGACVWMNEDFVECYGNVEIFGLTTGGLVTSGSNSTTVTDSTQSFITKGVKRGDLVQNFNDETDLFTRTADAGSSGTTLVDVGASFTNYDTDGPYELMIINNATGVQGVVTQIIDDDTLVAESYPGGPAISFAGGNSYTLREPQYLVALAPSSATTLPTRRLINNTAPDFDTGEYYRVVTAANSTSGSASVSLLGILCTALGLGGADCLQDTSENFGTLGVEPGDVVENTTDGSFGVISGVSGNTIATTLYGGTLNSFTIGNNYVVYHGYVTNRTLQFRVRFNGGSTSPKGKNVHATAGVRKRDACIGYGTTCAAIGSAASLPHNSLTPVITITDYEDDGDLAATTTSVIPTSGSPTGNIRVRNIDYYLAEGNGELPSWFVNNRWHQYVYAGFSSGWAPGAGGTCTAGTDCLQVQPSSIPYAAAQTDRQALVLVAGSELASQNRATGLPLQNPMVISEDEYFDGQNATGGDDVFERNLTTATFNDVVSTVCPDPLNADCP